MNEMLHLNLIRLFGFYLAATFLIGTVRRVQLYSDVARIALAFPNRWQRVFEVMKGHRLMFLTGATLRPLILTLILMIAYTVASRVVWPEANLTMIDLLNEWWMLPLIVVLGGCMLTLDVLTVYKVANIDQKMIEKYLDDAEHWLGTWKARLVSVLTLGFIRPRRIVFTEVEKAVMMGRDLLQRSLWWMSMQYGFRIAFGLALWGTWVAL